MRCALALGFIVALAAVARAQDEAPLEPGYERSATDDLVLDRKPVDDALGQAAASLFRESRAAVEDRLGVALGKFPPPRVVLAPSDAEFDRLHARLAGRAPEGWVLAVAIPARRTILMRASRIQDGRNFLVPTLRHEIAHLVLANVARAWGRPLPRWLDEGLAELASGVELSRDEELDLAAAARFGSLERLGDLDAAFPPHAARAERAYRLSLSFVLWLDEKAKPEGVRGLLLELERRSTLDDAVSRLTGLSLGECEDEWRRTIAAKHSIAEALLRSSGFWWGVVALLAIVAFIRSAIVSRRLRRKLELEDRGA